MGGIPRAGAEAGGWAPAPDGVSAQDYVTRVRLPYAR